MEGLASCEGFDWDAGNRDKNWNKHGVSTGECEKVFFDQPLVVAGMVRERRRPDDPAE